MQKAMFKRLMLRLKARWDHISKRKRFARMRDNPAGTKMAKRCLHTSRRGADGTMRN